MSRNDDYVLEIDLARIAAVSEALPREVLAVARLFDGFRTVEDVLRDSPVEFETAVEVVRRLADMGLLNMRPRRLSGSRRFGPEVNRWLGDPSPQEPREPLEDALDRAFSESAGPASCIEEIPFLLERSLEVAMEVQIEEERGLVGIGSGDEEPVEFDETGFLDADVVSESGNEPVWDLGGFMMSADVCTRPPAGQ